MYLKRVKSMATVQLEPRKRLTRKESRAQTRTKLIAVGRAHFLRNGLGGAVAEKIAEDAGYSRGALYSNFDSKEELFLAVIDEQKMHHHEAFEAILRDTMSTPSTRLRRFRDAFTEVITDRDWIILYSEFEAEALRNRRIRASFLKLHRRAISDGVRLVGELAQSPGITLRLKPRDFILAMLNFSLGLAVNQKILGNEFSSQCARKLIQSLFDELIMEP